MNMNLVKLSFVCGAALIISGCSTITFTNDNEPSYESYGQMHHTLVWGLVEYSEPVRPAAYCDSDWAEVTVEKDFLTYFVGSLDNVIIPFVDVWNPFAVTTTCAR